MRIFNLAITALIICFSSCTDNGKKSEVTNNDTVSTMKMATDSNVITAAIDSTHTAENSLDWKGTYKGIVPCADCDGIQTEIMLHSDKTYMISTKYLASKSMKETMSDGKFKWVNGSTIQLEGLKEGPSIYAVEENKIVQLDKDGKKIEGANAAKYILTKN